MMPKQTHILVVDDDAGHLATLKTIARSWGYRVSTADDGSIAVELAKEQPFDLILMDVRMAEVDGIEALRQIKTYNPAIPILIMTAYSSVASAVDAIKAGAYDYLTKPLDFEALRLAVERAMEHAPQSRESPTEGKTSGRIRLAKYHRHQPTHEGPYRHGGHGGTVGGYGADHR